MKQKVKKQKKFFEILALSILIVISFVAFAYTRYVPYADNVKGVLVFLGDKRITNVDGKEITLSIDATYKIGDDVSGYNIIEIKNKKVRCIEADCPDKICVSHSYLRDDIDNDMIICAPHGLTIMYER